MLAAKLDHTQPLSLFSLVLSLIRAGQQVPQGLREHFILIIDQARQLVREPAATPGRVNPEAIDLAVQMKAKPDLSDEINRIRDFEGIRSEQASTVLSKIDLPAS